MRYIGVILIMLLVSGCGYIPSAKHSRAVVGQSISTSVIISLVDPENTVIIKDGVDAAIIEVFHASLTTKSQSQTHLTVKLSNPSYSPIQYDADGFVVSYRTTVSLGITRSTKGEDSKNYTARGTYDFSITPNAIISDKQRFDAIKFSSSKAIRSFVAQVSAEGARNKLEGTTTQTQEEMKNPKHKEIAKKQEVISRPTTSISSRLKELDKAYYMKIDGLLSDEEFEAMKKDILTR